MGGFRFYGDGSGGADPRLGPSARDVGPSTLLASGILAGAIFPSCRRHSGRRTAGSTVNGAAATVPPGRKLARMEDGSFRGFIVPYGRWPLRANADSQQFFIGGQADFRSRPARVFQGQRTGSPG